MLTQLRQMLSVALTRHYWFGLSLVFATLYGILALQQAFSGEYVVQDDARQHVFWMRRFLNPDLFPHDLIADYFQSVAPWGYTTLYQIFAFFGIDPLDLNKVLPLILGLVTTSYAFGVCVQILPIPITGFIGAMLLNQNLWMQDGLISATPKAFIYPFFLAFLYYLLRREIIFCAVAIALLGLFYPSLLFVCILVLVFRLCRIKKWRLRLSPHRQDYQMCIAGVAVAVIVLLPYALNQGAFSPVISAAQARTLPEFFAGGRTSFFNNDPWEFWFNEARSGIRLTSALMPPLVYAGLLLPIFLQYPAYFQLLRFSRCGILFNLILASFVMFFTAHALLFKLHLPSRYTQHSLRIVMIAAAAVVLTLIIHAVLVRARLLVATTLIIGATLVFYPLTMDSFLWTGYIIGKHPALYQFFQQQPPNVLIASLADEANNLPTFSQRSILVGSEYAVPYHWGYYRQFRQRTLDLIQAQYSQDLAEVQQFIQKYNIDFWLIEQNAFTPEYLTSDRWLRQFQPSVTNALQHIHQKNLALSNLHQCTAAQIDNFIVLQAQCIKAQ